jgi:actin-related protein 5
LSKLFSIYLPEDLFGADDADWNIYLKINTTAPSSDEEEDMAQLQAIEQKLLAHDPTFTMKQTHASITTQKSALMGAFRPVYSDGDVEGHSVFEIIVLVPNKRCFE